nr:hypothetical protein [Desulfobulbus propionicus]
MGKTLHDFLELCCLKQITGAFEVDQIGRSGLSPVDSIHAPVNAFLDEHGDRFRHQCLALLKQAHFGITHSPQHKLIDGLPLPHLVHDGTTDADLQPGKFRGAKVLGHGTNAIVSSSAPFGHQLDPAGAQIDIIVEDQKIT